MLEVLVKISQPLDLPAMVVAYRQRSLVGFECCLFHQLYTYSLKRLAAHQDDWLLGSRWLCHRNLCDKPLIPPCYSHLTNKKRLRLARQTRWFIETGNRHKESPGVTDGGCSNAWTASKLWKNRISCDLKALFEGNLDYSYTFSSEFCQFSGLITCAEIEI